MSVKYNCDLCKEDIDDGEFWGQITISASNNQYHIHQHCEKILHNLFNSKEKPTIIITDGDKEIRLIKGEHLEYKLETEQMKIGPEENYGLEGQIQITNHSQENVYFSLTTKKEYDGSNK